MALDSAGAARHNRLAKPPPKALSIEGPGFDANQTSRAFVLFAISSTSIAEAGPATAGAGTAVPHRIESQQADLLPGQMAGQTAPPLCGRADKKT
jgi:hypothetical protein